MKETVARKQPIAGHTRVTRKLTGSPKTGKSKKNQQIGETLFLKGFIWIFW
jgi:hypothetical protein